MTDDATVPPTAPRAVGAALRERREALVADGPPPGPEWCEAWTAEVDAVCAALWEDAADRDDFTVVAVGGYGRSHLCPMSDVDLLLVVDDESDRDARERMARDLFHPLWDAGLVLGHQVRAASQLASDAVADLDTATAVLDGRVVAGDPGRFDAGHAELVERLAKRPTKFLDALADADAERRARHGDAAEQLEPDLKSGAGALRDVQSLRWAAAAVAGEPSLAALEPVGHVGVEDEDRLTRAEHELLTLRVALHLVTGIHGDVLRMEHQQAVAELVGEVDGDDDRDTAAHRVLRRHYLAARTVDHAHDRAWRRLRASSRRWGFPRRRAATTTVAGLTISDGQVFLGEDEDPADPALPARVVTALLAGDHVLGRVTASRLRAAADRLEVPVPWPEELRTAWLAMLASERGPRIQAELDDVDWLVALLPEWAPLRGRSQRNPFHLHALDRHLTHAAGDLARIVAHEPWAEHVLADVDRRDALRVGTWLHDVGKVDGEPHSETGVPRARAIATRIGLPQLDVNRVEQLVRLHLLLPEHGTRRDVSDPEEARAVADMVGSRGLLASLHLLAAADGAATGPTAWSGWKASLVSVLVTKVRAVLDDTDPAALDDGADATATAAVRLAPDLGVDPDAVRDHLAAMPDRYTAAVSPRAVVRHTRLAADPLEPGEVRTRVTPTEVPGDVDHDELDVVALDSPGLFASVAGVVALHGGSILEAHAHTREDGVAVDTLTVVVPEHATGSWWVTVEGDLAEAVAGRLAVRARVARKRAGEQRRIDKLPEVGTDVRIEPDAAGRTTLVRVRTMDRVGVLYRIASALAELSLDLVVAKVSTEGLVAIDAFSVRDAAGKPLDDHHQRELDLAIRAALGE